MKTVFKWLLRLIYFIVIAAVIGIALGIGLVRYDEIQLKKKAEIIKESIKQQLPFPAFLEKHPDFTIVSLHGKSGPRGLCLSVRQMRQGSFFLDDGGKIDFPTVVELFRQKIDGSDCRAISIIYFSNADAIGLWRASFSLAIDDMGRIERVESINIYR